MNFTHETYASISSIYEGEDIYNGYYPEHRTLHHSKG
jgi:hypothetical protein